MHPKDPVPKSLQKGVIYQVPCSVCDSTYIGQTCRTMEHRLKEHKRALTSFDAPFSAVAEHAMAEGHGIAWKEAKVLDVNSKLHQRCCLESWYIRKEGVSMNRDEGSLPFIYNSLIRGEQKRLK